MAITVTFTPYQKQLHQTLGENWLTISTKVECNFFLSWDWISSWLLSFDGELFIVEAKENNQLVAIALIGQSSRKIFKFFTVKQWHLNKAGVQKVDQCWIEYNDILAINKPAKEALLTALANSQHWHELSIGMAAEDELEASSLSAVNKRRIIELVGYRVNFAQIQEQCFEQSLSKNTRQKLSKNQRELELFGKVNFAHITNSDEIIKALPTIANWHIKRWQNHNPPSGFSNEHFYQFIRALIKSNKQISAQLIKLQIDNKDIGYLLNFVEGNKVYFYLSAIDTDALPNINIGNVLHSWAIKYYQSIGMTSYDFLLGDYQYKRSLSNQKYSQSMRCYYKNSVLLIIEQFARKIKSVFISTS
ncbi:GNAT family N-acetyltransferase [Thalassomonas sp. M1454]|uniref:GNAT family N-acetyltransferase n=1 Tax=Thalassomonas sp. M1454 TaxID=2594477 RepID=UPI00117FBBD5|nr:GNAT family N-acetyltransferase [Thalassomonas sp. M1454]TRX57930.1 GNAT family N-acetyltransferase [Thalassomonas sp. M1454]